VEFKFQVDMFLEESNGSFLMSVTFIKLAFGLFVTVDPLVNTPSIESNFYIGCHEAIFFVDLMFWS